MTVMAVLAVVVVAMVMRVMMVSVLADIMLMLMANILTHTQRPQTATERLRNGRPRHTRHRNGRRKHGQGWHNRRSTTNTHDQAHVQAKKMKWLHTTRNRTQWLCLDPKTRRTLMLEQNAQGTFDNTHPDGGIVDLWLMSDQAVACNPQVPPG